jgi:3-oxoacyl-[acyl-carrier-protein] synthase-3
VLSHLVSGPTAGAGGATIVGLGRCLPEQVVTNDDLSLRLETDDEWIRTRTGIRERRVAAAHQATSDLAIPAARQALQSAGVDPGEVDLILCCTATPDYLFPATACLIQDAIGAKRAAAFDLGAGCSGFVYGLAVADAFIRAGLYRTVLVCGAETLSKILDWDDRTTAVLLGDGAGAAVLRPAPPGYGILASYLGSDGSGGMLVQQPAGGSRHPASAETVAARMHTFRQNGREVYRFATQIMGDAAERALLAAGLRPEDVDWLVPHQANLRIIEAAARRFAFPMERVWVNIDRYGNMSTASIPVALAEAVEQGRLRPGQVVLAVAFGAGLTWGAVAMRWSMAAAACGTADDALGVAE